MKCIGFAAGQLFSVYFATDKLDGHVLINKYIQWNLFYLDIDQLNATSTDPPR